MTDEVKLEYLTICMEPYPHVETVVTVDGKTKTIWSEPLTISETEETVVDADRA